MQSTWLCPYNPSTPRLQGLCKLSMMNTSWKTSITGSQRTTWSAPEVNKKIIMGRCIYEWTKFHFYDIVYCVSFDLKYLLHQITGLEIRNFQLSNVIENDQTRACFKKSVSKFQMFGHFSKTSGHDRCPGVISSPDYTFIGKK